MEYSKLASRIHDEECEYTYVTISFDEHEDIPDISVTRDPYPYIQIAVAAKVAERKERGKR